MAASRTLEGMIVRNPALHDGRPVIAGTGVTVRTVAGWFKLGYSAEEIAADMPLTLAQVYSALAYYELNREEIEADIEADSEERLMRETGYRPREH